MKKNNNRLLQKLFLVFFSALLFVLANPNILINSGAGFLAWIYYIPVLVLVKKSELKHVWKYGFLYGLLSYAGYAYWLLTSYKAAYFFVVSGYAIILAVVFLFLKIAEKLFPKNHFIIQGLILCSYEFLKTLGFLGLNYGVTSYTQYDFKPLIQICDLTGPFGLNLLIIFFSAIIFSFAEKVLQKKAFLYKTDSNFKSGIQEFKETEKKQKENSVKFSVICLVIWICLFTFSFTYGLIRLNQSKNHKTIKVCAVQNNENPWENGFDFYSENVRTLKQLTTEALELNPDIQLVVWPETAVIPAIVYNYTFENDKRRYELVSDLLSYMNSWNCSFVIGNGHEVLERGSKKFYNSALVFTPKKNVIPPEPEIYSKIHLVPFSESFPLKQKFPEIYTMLVKNGSQMWENGKEYNSFIICDDFVFSTPICFEDTFTETGRKMYQKGARCFVNLTNDSWSQSKVCQKQHLAMAIFRSVENRVPTVRSTTSGITCFINSKGQITNKTEEFTESCLIGNIEIIDKNQKETFYTRTGDWIGYTTIVITVVLLIIKMFVVIIKKNRK